MFYFGGVRKGLSSLALYTWHEHVDTGKKLKEIHGPNSVKTVEKLRIRHSIILQWTRHYKIRTAFLC